MKKRLVARGTETEETINKRLENSQKEIDAAIASHIFSKFFVNNEREQFLNDATAFIEGLYLLKGTTNF